MISGGPNNTSIGSAVEPLIQVSQTNFSSQFTLSAQKLVEQFAAGNVSCTAQDSLVSLNGIDSAIVSPANFSGGVASVAAFEVWGVETITTTITETFTVTIPFSSDVTNTGWNTQTTMSFVTSTIPTSTLSTSVASVTPRPTGLSSANLVFGRCVILAVVQESGVASAASVQRLIQSAVNQGQTIVNGSGLKIDLGKESVSGLSG
jgi:hypothetical protein